MTPIFTPCVQRSEREVYKISVRSMNTDDRLTEQPTTDLRAYSHILGKFQMAITLQCVVRSTVWFYGGVFGDGRSNGAISGCIRPPFCKLTRPYLLNTLSRFTLCMQATQRRYFSLGLYNDCWLIMIGDWTLVSQERVTSRPKVYT